MRAVRLKYGSALVGFGYELYTLAVSHIYVIDKERRTLYAQARRNVSRIYICGT